MPRVSKQQSTAAIRRAIDKAMHQYSKRLEALCKAATVRLSRHYQGEVTFCSAMGSWGWSTKDRDESDMENHRALRGAVKAMQAAYDDYGYGPIPAPIMIKAQGGKITEIKFDW